MNFKLRKPNEKSVLNGIGGRVSEINKYITDAQLNICVSPKMDIDGRVIGFQPDMEVVKKETRKYHLFGQVLELPGTVYGIGKNENGKFTTTFFMPDMVEDPSKANQKDYMISLFTSALNLMKLIKDCQYWQMPARIVSDLANQAECDPALAQFIGYNYGMELFSNDEAKFSRATWLQYVDGEIDVFNELLSMAKGDAKDADTITLASSNGDAYVPKDEAISINNYQTPVKRFGKVLTAHGISEAKKTSTFSFANKNSAKLDNAGKSALNLKK